MSCSHAKPFQLPTAHSSVFRDECTLCFDSQDSPLGIDVCLQCYNGACPSDVKNHSKLHYQKTDHALVLNIKRSIISSPSERPQKITKLSINEKDDTQYDFKTSIKCLACDRLELDKSSHNFTALSDALMNAISAKKQSEIKSWEEETLQSCYHTDELSQTDAKLEGKSLAHCNNCDLKENLWLCLTCGNLGCGRAQYGGLGGNGHGLNHFESTAHPIAVKMGSITPEGKADIFCYEHGNEILDPKLSKHLANFGINISQQEKTEKSIAEMQLEQNLKFDFSMTTEDGKELKPLYGSGFTGLANLGNSCYMASVIQTLFTIPAFQKKYFDHAHEHIQQCYDKPADCFTCQMCKLGDGLLSGRYSVAQVDEEGNSKGQVGIAPLMLKNIVGKGHPEFSSMRQQDAQEFLQHLLSLVQKKEHSSGQDPSKSCTFTIENRLQCLECERVSYKNNESSCLMLPVSATATGEVIDGKKQYQPVNLFDCLDQYFASDIREYNCSIDKQKTNATFSTKFLSYPDYLICSMSRFVLGEGWVMEKLNVKINAPLEISLDQFRGSGLQPNEEAFAEDSTDSGPQFNQEVVDQLLAMGFSENRCKRAILNTGHGGAEAAMEWLFSHMDDPNLDDPITSAAQSIPLEQLMPLMDMGFNQKQAERAMKETNNNMERAVDWLFSHPDTEEQVTESTLTIQNDTNPANYKLAAFISHKGTSAQCGHYVAYIRRDDKWVLFNDAKVVEIPDILPHVQDAYVYIYQRI
ncbi:hypothetical protein BC833DRAFT_596534 [Globomyces pollinis-pini]|nr:hypothetical protein BC833DRAFT_596534 [Globomyces pollinis-pini]